MVTENNIYIYTGLENMKRGREKKKHRRILKISFKLNNATWTEHVSSVNYFNGTYSFGRARDKLKTLRMFQSKIEH